MRAVFRGPLVRTRRSVRMKSGPRTTCGVTACVCWIGPGPARRLSRLVLVELYLDRASEAWRALTQQKEEKSSQVDVARQPGKELTVLT